MTRHSPLRSAPVSRPSTSVKAAPVNAVRRVLGSVMLGASIVVVLAGCGGATGSASPSAVAATASLGTPPTSAVSAAPGSAAASQIATPAASAPGASVPGTTESHADPALEALLPAEVSGTAMQRSSATLASLLAAGGDRAAIDAFLQSLGKSEDDGSFAFALDPTNTVGGGVFAFRIAGVGAEVLLPAIVSVEQSDLGAGATTRQATVGGKDVTVVSIGDGGNDTVWVYGKGEAVFVVHAPDEAHAAMYLLALA